jgi:hypothetical protein
MSQVVKKSKCLSKVFMNVNMKTVDLVPMELGVKMTIVQLKDCSKTRFISSAIELLDLSVIDADVSGFIDVELVLDKESGNLTSQQLLEDPQVLRDNMEKACIPFSNFLKTFDCDIDLEIYHVHIINKHS